MVRKRSEHYVNNKEFFAAIVAYKLDILESEKLGNQNQESQTILENAF